MSLTLSRLSWSAGRRRASSAPPRYHLAALPPAVRDSIRAARWVLRRQQALEGAVFGARVGLVIALALVLVSWLWPLFDRPALVAWASLTVGLVALFGGLVGLLQPLSVMVAARAIDRRLALRERISTALELANTLPRPSFFAAQSADAVAALAVHPWRAAFQPRLGRRPRWMTLGLGALLLMALIVPHPQQAALDERALTRQALAAEVQRVAATRERVASRRDLEPAQQAALTEALRQLEQDLRRGDLDRRQAVARVAAAEAALRQQTDATLGQRGEGLNRLAQELLTSGYTAPAGRALRQGDPAGAAKDLTNLAGRLDRLDEGERQALANKLDRAAASQAVSNPALAADLSAAAAALQHDEVAEAGQQLAAAADQLRDLAADQAARAERDRLLGELAQTRQQVASAGQAAGSPTNGRGTPVAVDRGDGAQGATKAGSGQGASPGDRPGQGASPGGRPGQGAGQGQSSGQSSAGTNQGGGQGQVGGATNPRTNGGTAGPGQPIQDRPGTTGSGDYAPIYAPGHTGSSGETSAVGGRDSGQGGSESRPVRADGARTAPLVPYQQVYGQYRQQATSTLENGGVPPALRDYVRDYFSALDEPTP